MSANRCPARRTRVATSRPFGRIFHSFLSSLITLLLILAVAPLVLLSPASIAHAAGDLTVQVYNDGGRDGVYSNNTSDPGINGVQVFVYNRDNQLAGFINTAGGGLASFPGLANGDYRIEVFPPGDYVVSVPGANNTGLVSFVTIDNSSPTVQVGLRQLLNGIDPEAPEASRSIVVRVWNDRNGNGIQDAGEPGYSGLTLELVNSSGAVVPDTVVSELDATGRYHIAAAPLTVGLRVRVAGGVPEGYALTRWNVNDGNFTPDVRDSDAPPSLLPAVSVGIPTAGPGVNNDSFGIGFARGSVSGYVWNDTNANGLLNLGETRLNGIPVELLDAGGNVVQETTTRSESGPGGLPGFYQFTDLTLGVAYRVRIPIAAFAVGQPLAGFANSPNAAGGDQGLPNGMPSGAGVVIGPFTLNGNDVSAGSHLNTTARFGFYRGAVGDFVWLDLDGDGVVDSGETGLNGIRLFIDVNANGVLDDGEPVAITDDDPLTGLPGYYLFTNLPLGSTYRVTLDPAQFAADGPLAGFQVNNATLAPAPPANVYYITSATLAAVGTGNGPLDRGVDFGLFPPSPATVTGRIFFDGANAAPDNLATNEPGLTSVVVRLFSSPIGVEDVPLQTTSTNTTGAYTFNDVDPGSYIVEFDNPDDTNFGYRTTVAGDNHVNGVDDTTSDGRTASFTVGSGATATRNAAAVGVGSLTGLVWHDLNGDGVRAVAPADPIDPLLANARVQLNLAVNLTNLNTTIARTLTATPATGVYDFSGLPSGSITALTFTPPTGATWATTVNSSDSNPPAANTTFTAAATPVTYSQGYYRPVSISARVFESRSVPPENVWRTGDVAIGGVAVRLDYIGPLDPAVWGARLPSTPASSNATTGLVNFTNLPPGTYNIVVVTNPTGFVALGDTTLNLGTLASGGSSLTGTTAPSSVNVFGYSRPATINGTIFFDRNDDNVLTGEPPIRGGVTVRLLNSAGEPLDPARTTTTNATNGTYSFTDVPVGNYIIEFDDPYREDFRYSTTLAGSNHVNSIDDTTGDGRTATFNATSGTTTVRNAAVVGIGSMTGEVWVDQNANGNREAGDTTLTGVRVNLSLSVPADGTYLTTDQTVTRVLMSTGTNGLYNFVNLPSGTITSLSFTPPTLTPPWQPTTAGTDSNPPAAGATFTASATPVSFNQGLFRDAIIAARVFDEQVTIDNIFQSGEIGLSGVTVSLNPGNLTATTGFNGIVSFTVRPGVEYTLAVPSEPDGFNASPGNSGSVIVPAPLSGSSNLNSPTPFGYYLPSAVGGKVWFDLNGDGRLTSNEPTLQGLTVTLRDSNNASLQTTTTAADGSYNFAEVAPNGSESAYSICFDLPTGLAATTKGEILSDLTTSDINANGCTDPFAVDTFTTIDYINAGVIATSSISGLIFNDLNTNGSRDTGEPALANAVVTVEVTTTNLVPNVLSLSATSASDGTYTIAGVPPAGSYRVVSVIPPLGYLPSTPINTAPVARSIPPDVTGLNFGFYVTTTVGDFVWLDLDANGRFDEGEPGVPGVSVELRAADNTLVRTTTTASGDQAGRYAFNELEPDTYSLRFIAPTGFVFTNNGLGVITTDNDNDARLDGTTVQFTLISSQILGSVDAGLRGSASIAGQTWDDTNRDGVRDASEAPLAGVVVTLSLQVANVAEPIIATATTSIDGSYSFNNLPPGQATLSFATPTNYEPTGTAPAPFALAAGEARTEVNQGFAQIRIDPPPPGRLSIYLPLIVRSAPPEPERQPDLSVTAITVTPATPQAFAPTRVEVTITNTGDAPANNFWVDFYINPSRVPSVNERWNDTCNLDPCYGIAWLITTPLAPGESRVLNSDVLSAANPNGIDSATSIWLGYFANGTNKLFAYVDSWNPGFAQGAVIERNEDNNRFERDIIVTPGTAPANSATLQQHNQLPERYLP